MNPDTLRILLVEDNPEDRRAFERFVREENQPFAVVSAGSVEEAKQELTAQAFDAIVSDFRLHDGTALDLFDRVEGVPIVVMTGAGDEAVAVKTMQAGAADYLVKDGENRHLQTLPASIRNAVSRKKNEAELENYRFRLETMVAERTRDLEREVAERRAAEEKLRSVNNSLRILTACNQAFLRQKTRDALLDAVCRIVVRHGGYRMAWIGRAERDDAGSIAPLAQAGRVDGYFDEVRLSWSDLQYGSCPEGRAIRSGEIAHCVHTGTDLAFTPWRTAARRRDYGSILALPLTTDVRERSVFAVYAAEPEAFRRETVQFFRELADDLEFTLANLRLQEERRVIDEALKQSENRYRTLLESSTDAVFLLDRDERILYLNTTAARMLRGTQESLVGKRQRDFFPPDLAERHSQSIRKVFESGEHFSSVVTDLISGSETLFHTRLVPIRDHKGEIHSVMGISRDVTALVRMEEDRRKAETAQRESEAKLQRLVQNAKDVIFRIRLNPAPVLEYLSPAVTRTIGYSPEELIEDRELAMSLIAPDDRPFLQKLMNGEVDFGKMMTLRWRSREGRMVWMEQIHIPVFNAEGKLEAVEGIARDISERMEAEKMIRDSLKEKEILLKEVHHRVKNNLQVISSLLRLQSTYIKEPRALDMFLETQNRFRSMALIHEKLYQSGDLEKIHIPGYIRMLANDLFKLYGATARHIELNLKMQDVSMNLSTAVPCGLIVNELLSNALKHGFPPGRAGKGRVKIGLCRMGRRKIHLFIGDNGIGLPETVDFRKVSTLGLHLVRILAEDQLGGRVRIVRRNGTAFHLLFEI